MFEATHEQASDPNFYAANVALDTIGRWRMDVRVMGLRDQGAVEFEVEVGETIPADRLVRGLVVVAAIWVAVGVWIIRGRPAPPTIDGRLTSGVPAELAQLEAAAHGAEGADLDGDAVAIRDNLIRERRDAASRASGCRPGCSGSPVWTRTTSPLELRAPHRAQRVDGLRQRVLLADEPGDEAPAADFASCFQAAVDGKQRAPGWRLAFAPRRSRKTTP